MSQKESSELKQVAPGVWVREILPAERRRPGEDFLRQLAEFSGGEHTFFMRTIREILEGTEDSLR